MCGIVGVINPSYGTHMRAFSDLLFMDTLRGHHSTGCFWEESSGKTLYHKALGPAPVVLANDKTLKYALGTSSHRYMVGHNRWATRGEVTVDNAHPFAHGPITGVHNGTLDNEDNLLKVFGTDSEAIIHAMSEKGAKKVIEGLEGAFTLVWSDHDKGTLSMCRNSERPLWLVRSFNTVFFASEKYMLLAALERNRVSWKDADVTELPEGVILTFNVRAGKSEDRAKPVATKVTLKPKRSYLDRWQGYYPRDGYRTGAAKAGQPKDRSLATLKDVNLRYGEPIHFVPVAYYRPTRCHGGGDFITLYGIKKGDKDMARTFQMILNAAHMKRLGCKTPEDLLKDVASIKGFVSSVQEYKNGGFHHTNLKVVPDLVNNIVFLTANSPSRGGITIVDKNPAPLAATIDIFTQHPYVTSDPAVLSDQPQIIRHLLADQETAREIYRECVDLSKEASGKEDSRLGKFLPAIVSTKKTTSHSNVESLNRTYTGPEGEELTLKEWSYMVRGGCVMCTVPIMRRWADTMGWAATASPSRPYRPVCPECDKTN